MAIKNQGTGQSPGFIQVGGSTKAPPTTPKPAQGYPSTQTTRPQAAPPTRKCGSCGKW
jgi:hypothetical protein